jgi:hypothetical protein
MPWALHVMLKHSILENTNKDNCLEGGNSRPLYL